MAGFRPESDELCSRNARSGARDRAMADQAVVRRGDQQSRHVDSFKQALSDRYGAPDAVCRSPAPRSDGSVSATVASLIMDAYNGRMWIAPAPYAGAARYSEYRLFP